MFRKILLPVDGSEAAQAAAEQGIALAAIHAAEVILLTVRVPVPILLPPAGFIGDAPMVCEELDAANQTVLNKLEKKARELRVGFKTVVRTGDPAQEILAV